MTDSQQLLAEYAKTGSEPAFRELVTRYVDLVYSAAVRMVNGDTHLAEDISQTVFTDLAQKARTLSSEVMLGGWLHRHTCYVAAKALRTERRRQTRERLSVEMNELSQSAEVNLAMVAPILDEAINELGDEDRKAILLRFFETRDFRSIGESLGSTEEAARKRVARALDKMHAHLGKRGFALSLAALTGAMAGGVSTAAPLGLAASISAKALVSGAASGTGWALLKFMASTKIKAALASGVVLASAVTSLVLHQQSESRLVAAERQLLEQGEKVGALQPDRPKPLRSANPLSNQGELSRMRAEVAALRQQRADLAKLEAESQSLRTALRQARGELSTAATPASPTPPEAMARSRYCRDLGMAMRLYASDHQDRLPTSFAEVTTYLSEVTKETNLVPAQFEIVFHGALDDLTNYAHPGGILLVREKVPLKSPDGRWYKGYGFADGSGSVHAEKDGNFTAWEEKRIIRTMKP
jgi:RNA polymerase sigma factor (sigma-70 family)